MIGGSGDKMAKISAVRKSFCRLGYRPLEREIFGVSLWNISIVALLFPLFFCPARASSSDHYQEVRTLIANRQLDAAEKIIVTHMMIQPQDPELITLLAEVRMDQGRAEEALTLTGDA